MKLRTIFNTKMILRWSWLKRAKIIIIKSYFRTSYQCSKVSSNLANKYSTLVMKRRKSLIYQTLPLKNKRVAWCLTTQTNQQSLTLKHQHSGIEWAKHKNSNIINLGIWIVHLSICLVRLHLIKQWAQIIVVWG